MSRHRAPSRRRPDAATLLAGLVCAALAALIVWAVASSDIEVADCYTPDDDVAGQWC